jgi:hypothetical protein
MVLLIGVNKMAVNSVAVCVCVLVTQSPDGYGIGHATSRDMHHVPLKVLNKHRMTISKAVEGKLKGNPVSYFGAQLWHTGGATE